MSSSALPLYNMDKLIYKSGFFNKFKEMLPIVFWFLRKGEKGSGRLPGSGESDKHGRALLPEAVEGSLWLRGRGEEPLRFQCWAARPGCTWVMDDATDAIPRVRE